MARFMCMGFVGVIVAVVLMQFTAAQTVHLAGDDLGWTVPSNKSAYSTWAASNRFIVGDILVFNFTTNEHDVLQVPKASFDACSDDNRIGNMMTDGPAKVTLGTAGEHYYICTIGNGRYCQLGQKLAITVSATSGSPLPAPTPTVVPPKSSSSTVFASSLLIRLEIEGVSISHFSSK
ncbi:hypothetical protein PTKIN_Ptkin18bG0041300 [Pterospermum kingtungense]